MSVRSLHLVFLLLVGASITLSAQEFSVRQFGIDDGLPSSSVYEVKQDKLGYYWIATDQGLVKYDGYEFHQIGEGNSPFNRDIWWSHADQENRIWAVGAGNQLWYLENDSLQFRTLKTTGKPNVHLKRMFVDNYGNVVFLQNWLVNRINYNGDHSVTRLKRLFRPRSDAPPELVQASDGELYLISKAPLTVEKIHEYGDGQPIYEYPLNIQVHSQEGPSSTEPTDVTILVIINQDSIYTINNDVLTAHIKGVTSNHKFPAHEKITELSYRVNVLKNMVAFIHSNGSFITDKNFNHLPQYDFISQYNINTVYEDHEGCLWISTTDQGLIYQSTDAVATETIQLGSEMRSAVVAIDQTLVGDIWVGYRNGNICQVNNGELNCFRPRPTTIKDPNWMLYDLQCTSSFIAASVGNFEVHFYEPQPFIQEPELVNVHQFHVVKSISKDYRDQLNVSDYYHSYSIRSHQGAKSAPVQKTAYRSFAYTTNGKESELISTDAGLKIIHSSGDSILIESDSRIRKFEAAGTHGTFGINSGRGAVLIRKDILLPIKPLENLLVRDLDLENDSVLWAATNKGIIALHHTQDGFTFRRKLTLAHGLPTVDATAILVNDTNIYVGTSKGLSIIDRSFLSRQETSTSVILEGITLSGREIPIDQLTELPPSQNSIVFNYVFISPKSDGQIKYEYRLIGLDEDWKQTSSTSVEYSFLPPGKYAFELKAYNINGIESNNTLNIEFSVRQFWWKTAWFILGFNLLLIAVAILLYSARVRRIKREESESTEINRRLADLKLNALRSQMNPHFVFNVLNSIQECFLNQDLEEANQYLSDFSKLMRLFLETSGERYNTLTKELSILQPYVELERMRLQFKFKFDISVDDEIDMDEIHVPSMIIQPIVENAILHGLRYKEGEGKLSLEFTLVDSGTLKVMVQDDGIGRVRSSEINQKKKGDHESMANKIINERMELLNLSETDRLEINIEDLYTDGTPAGTKVTLLMDLALNT